MAFTSHLKVLEQELQTILDAFVADDSLMSEDDRRWWERERQRFCDEFNESEDRVERIQQMVTFPISDGNIAPDVNDPFRIVVNVQPAKVITSVQIR